MLIQVSGKGFQLSSKLRYEVEERIEIAFERFSKRIDRVVVFLADENGPKNGVDKSLRIIIDLKGHPLLVVEEKGDTWHTILDRSVDRATHTISRQVERMRTIGDRTSMSGDAVEASDAEVDSLDGKPW